MEAKGWNKIRFFPRIQNPVQPLAVKGWGKRNDRCMIRLRFILGPEVDQAFGPRFLNLNSRNTGESWRTKVRKG